MIQIEPATDEEDDKHAEGQRQHVVGVVRAGGDVQEEHQMHAHLGDGEHDQGHRNGRPVNDMRPGQEEGCRREHDREA